MGACGGVKISRWESRSEGVQIKILKVEVKILGSRDQDLKESRSVRVSREQVPAGVRGLRLAARSQSRPCSCQRRPPVAATVTLLLRLRLPLLLLLHYWHGGSTALRMPEEEGRVEGVRRGERCGSHCCCYTPSATTLLTHGQCDSTADATGALSRMPEEDGRVVGARRRGEHE